MKINSEHRAIDKFYKRRDRYDIPDWQREEVWSVEKKQLLIDSILRGWKLPKFYFLRSTDDPEQFEVVDGQQRLAAIFEFFDNTLPLSKESAARFAGTHYKDLTPIISDAFDDFEIEYDEIVDADETEIKEFFQRLQQGLPLTSSERLNAVHSKLRDFCKTLVGHQFFAQKVGFANKRYSHFDVLTKVAAIEIDGLATGLRFEDLKATFHSQSGFSSTSAVAKNLLASLDYLDKAFPQKCVELRNRTIVQSVITLAARLVATGRAAGHEARFRDFITGFAAELSHQVELGIEATDPDYLEFQHSVNANVRGGAKARHEIMLRKMLRADPIFGEVFDPAIVAQSGLSGDIAKIGKSVRDLVEKANGAYAAKHGSDLFKATNKTVAALGALSAPIDSLEAYKGLLEDLYFVFWESTGNRLDGVVPVSFTDVRDLRTDLQHDVDHGKPGEIAAKKKKLNAVFVKYAGSSTPATLAPERFPVVQANLLAAIENDLKALLGTL
jgi:hypothetical protein